MSQRTVFGKFIKWLFIGFNLFMVFSMWVGLKSANPTSTAESVGTGIGAMLLLFIWVCGAVILGLFVLFTRPK